MAASRIIVGIILASLRGNDRERQALGRERLGQPLGALRRRDGAQQREGVHVLVPAEEPLGHVDAQIVEPVEPAQPAAVYGAARPLKGQIGRASCRERV